MTKLPTLNQIIFFYAFQFIPSLCQDWLDHFIKFQIVLLLYNVKVDAAQNNCSLQTTGLVVIKYNSCFPVFYLMLLNWGGISEQIELEFKHFHKT